MLDHSSGSRPRNRSRSRRSRFVGRPAPRSRDTTAATSDFGGGGGVRSMRHSAATGAPTRLITIRTTVTVRSRSVVLNRTSSPIRTGWAGFARSPFTCTWPALQAAVAADRVFDNRTAQTQESTLAVGSAASTIDSGQNRCCGSRSPGNEIAHHHTRVRTEQLENRSRR